MFLAYGSAVPEVEQDVFVDGSARVIGSVRLGRGVTVLPGAVIRSEGPRISIGARSVIEDAAVLHVDTGGLVLGERVVVGHGAIVHGAEVGADTLVGMGATVLSGARIGSGCLIAAGALVTEGAVIPDGSLVVGVPGKVMRAVSDENRAYIASASDFYADWGKRAAAGELREVEPRAVGAEGRL